MASTAERSPEDRAPFLEIKGLTKLFGGVRAVEQVDFSMAAEEMRCIIGPNGCGKTTLFNLITGYLPPTSGNITFLGRDIRGLSLHEIARAGLVRKFQVPSVFPGLTVAANVESACHSRSNRAGRAKSSEQERLIAMVRLDRCSRVQARSRSAPGSSGSGPDSAATCAASSPVSSRQVCGLSIISSPMSKKAR